MADRLARTRTAWKRQHAAGEKLLNRKLRKFFQDQNSRIVSGLADFDTITLSTVAQVLIPADESTAMLEAIGETLIGFMATGAMRVKAAAPSAATPAKTTKAFNFSDFDLPQPFIAAIEASFADLTGQDYWQAVQQTTAEGIVDFLAEQINEGVSMPQLRRRLEETLGITSRVRAAAIARTETTMAYNAGHQSGFSALAAKGLMAKKEWLAVVDQDTRETHSEADGQQVEADANFELGGQSVPYPGHWSLSASERVNCRCTVAGVFEG